MDLIVRPTEKLRGVVSPSPSKFYTQFATATSLLAEGKSTVRLPLSVDDTRVLLHAIESMGATVKRTKDRWSIWGAGEALKPSSQTIDAKRSIVSLSLMASLASLSPHTIVVVGSDRLRALPMPSLVRALQKLGVDVHSAKYDESPPFVVFGGELEGGKISLGGEMDPSFLPAFLLMAPLAKSQVELVLTPNLKGHLLDAAVEILKERGIGISTTRRGLRVSPGSFKPIRFSPPPDVFSIAPYVTAALLTDSKLRVSGISKAKNLSQFIGLFEKVGADFEVTSRSLNVTRARRFGSRRISLEGFPELFPLISTLACTAEGTIKIMNAERARKAKSDRITAMAQGLERMGANIEENRDGLIVEGPADLKGEVVDGHDDDAVVAALGVAGLIAEGETVVKNRAEALRDSYQSFVSTFQDLGARMEYKV